MPLPLADLTALQSGLHLSTNHLFLEGEVSHGMSSHLARALHIMSLGRRDITLYLTTLGGSRTASMGMYDLLRACKSHITIIGCGDVSSAGILILQGADERLLMPNCRLMMHPGSVGLSQDLDENVMRAAKDCVQERDQFYKLIGQRAGLNLKTMMELYHMDTFLTSVKAIKLGLADGLFKG